MLTRVLFLASCSALALAQSKPAFEVVSIKPIATPSPADGAPFGFEVTPTRLQITGYPLFLILTRAFGIAPPQLDAPQFTHDRFFHIQATIPAGAKPEQVPQMLQAMLAERFRLSYRREAREYATNVLTVGKDGMKLQRLPDGAEPVNRRESVAGGVVRTTQSATVAAMVDMARSASDVQPVDGTGLDGIYLWVRDLPPASGGANYTERTRDSFETMFQAAGLRFDARKTPIETIVVEHIEPVPTEN